MKIPKGRRTVLLIVISVIGLTLLGCLAGGREEMTVQASEKEEVELGYLMGWMQRYQDKLGRSIDARNELLTRFYLGEMEEVSEKILEVEEYEDLLIGSTAEKIFLPPLEALEGQMETNDLDEEQWGEVEGAYGILVTSCNRCHTATDHEFIVVTAPDPRHVWSQSFSRE